MMSEKLGIEPQKLVNACKGLRMLLTETGMGH